MSAPNPAVASAAARTPVLGAAKRRTGEDAIRVLLFCAALLSILTTLGILFSLPSETVAFLGETMIVLVAAGQQPNFTADPRQSVETITTFIAATAKGDVATGSIAYKTIFAVGMVLFAMTLLMNTIAIRFVRRYRQVYE